MGKHAQLVMGPAGSGKSTYCKTIQDHCTSKKRTVHVVNLDPAAEYFDYSPSIDIRDLISLEDVMDEMNLGPNGGLIYCMDFLIQNIDWLRDEISDYSDDYIIFDCPGQIELYCHHPIMIHLVKEIQLLGYSICGVYCLDSQFLDETSKFISGTLMALSAMMHLEVSHVNVLTKMDILLQSKQSEYGAPLTEEQEQELLEDALVPDVNTLLFKLKTEDSLYKKLNQMLASIIGEYSLVSYVPLNRNDESSVEYVLSLIDHAMQYGEDVEVKDQLDVDKDVDELENDHQQE